MALQWNQTLGSKAFPAPVLSKRKLYLSNIPKSKIISNNPNNFPTTKPVQNQNGAIALMDVIPEEGSSSEDFFEETPLSLNPDDKYEAIPNFLNLSASRQFSSAVFHLQTNKFDAEIPPVQNPQFKQVIKSKLKLCKEVYCFSDPAVKSMRENKTFVLNQIVNMFDNYADLAEIPVELQNEIFEMIQLNIFDQNPKFPDLLESNFYTVQIFDPLWPHLLPLFQILAKFTQVYPYNKCFNDKLIKKAIFLTNLPDSNVRKHLFNFIKILLDKRVDFFHIILKSVAGQLNNVVYYDGPPYCVGILLQILTLLYNKSNRRPPSFFNIVIRHSVLPLISTSYFYLFVDEFNNLIANLLKPLSYTTLKSINPQLPANSQTTMPEKVSTLPLQPLFKSKTTHVKAIHTRSSSSESKPVQTHILPPLGNKNIPQTHTFQEMQIAHSVIQTKNNKASFVGSKLSNTQNTTSQVSKKNEKIVAMDVVEEINKYWPKTSSPKQVSVLSTLFSVMASSYDSIPSTNLSSICKFLAFQLESPFKKVCQTILAVFPQKPGWMKTNSDTVINNFYGVLYKLKLKEKNGDKDIFDAAEASLNALSTLNPKLFHTLSADVEMARTHNSCDDEWIYIFESATIRKSFHFNKKDFIQSLREMNKKGRDNSLLIKNTTH